MADNRQTMVAITMNLYHFQWQIDITIHKTQTILAKKAV